MSDWPWGGCRCHAHGIGHAPAGPACGFTVPVDLPDSPGQWRGREWRHLPLCTGCMHDGCEANRPLPSARGTRPEP